MLQQFFAIIRNTFFESIRQPIMLVVLMVAALLIILSNPLSAFTMEDDQRMMIDIGMATVFTGGALLASFIATSVLTREIENKTALTVISKPVGRPLFVVGKFVGVGMAMTVGAIFMSCVFLLTEHHGVLQTVRDPVHVPVVTFGVIAAVLGLGVGVWCNYFYGMAFSATVICTTTPLAALAWFFSLMFRFDFRPQPIGLAFEPGLLAALACVLMSILMLTAIAVAASTRFGQVMTLCITLGMFGLGMLTDWFFGRPLSRIRSDWLDRAQAQGMTTAETVTTTFHLTSGEINTVVDTVQVPTVPLTGFAEGFERLQYILSWVGYTVLPNFQRLWLADALTQGRVIPMDYVARAMIYGALYIVVVLSLAVIMFQRREVG